MIIQIEARTIEDILAQDEMLIPVIEDLLLDAVLEYRDKLNKAPYQSPAVVADDEDGRVRVSVRHHSPTFIHDYGQGCQQN